MASRVHVPTLVLCALVTSWPIHVAAQAQKPDAPRQGAFDGARTFAEQVKHVACANVAFFNEIEKKTPQNALDPAGGPYGGQSTRLGLTTLAIWHASDHYGQVVVYLRMNGVVPPASRPR